MSLSSSISCLLLNKFSEPDPDPDAATGGGHASKSESWCLSEGGDTKPRLFGRSSSSDRTEPVEGPNRGPCIVQLAAGRRSELAALESTFRFSLASWRGSSRVSAFRVAMGSRAHHAVL